MTDALAAAAPWLATGSIITVLISCWSYIKMYVSKIYGLFVLRARVDNYYVALAVSSYITRNFKTKLWLSPKIFDGRNLYVRPKSRTELVSFHMLPDEPTLFWCGWKPMIVNLVSEKGSNRNGDDSYSKGVMEIATFRFLFDLEKLIDIAVEVYNKQKSGGEIEVDDGYNERFQIVRLKGTGFKNKMSPAQPSQGARVRESSDKNNILGEPIRWKLDELGQPKSSKQLSIMSLDKATEEAIEEIRRWYKSKEWYNAKNLPWKRGILLFGAAGTGKTSVVRGLGQELDLPIYIMDIGTMDSSEFSEKWTQALTESPCIILIEDFDAVFDKRVNVVNKDEGLTFDCLLNHIDGAQNSDGVLTIITTNHIEKLDPALSNGEGESHTGNTIPSRPGRIDRAIKMPSTLSLEGRVKIANRILGEFGEDIVNREVQAGENETGAQFQERCGRLALKLFWEGKDKV